MGLGLMALAAARAATTGNDLDQLAQLVESLILRMRVVFVVETVEYLHEGGWVGGLHALLGLALRIGPILHVSDGRVEMLQKVRTKSKAKRRMLEIVEKSAQHSSAIHAAVVHAAALDEATELAAELNARVNCTELHVAHISPAVGVHTGPGTVGIAFYCES
jgi:DegV family protein with EDD domain